MCVAVHTINLMHSRSSSYVRCVLSCGIAQDQLRASLNERGIEVVGATSGVDALVRVSGRSGDFSAVVVAHEFWGTNEISLVKRLRALNGLLPIAHEQHFSQTIGLGRAYSHRPSR
jgi:CheY-like chemotaxis protein